MQNHREFLKTSTKVTGVFALISLSAYKLFANTDSKEKMMQTLTPTAKKNLTKLFDNSNLAQEDLEFLTHYANFAFDEVWTQSLLEESERLLLILASLSAMGAKEEFENILQASLNLRIPPIQIKEVIYQAMPYVGMSRIATLLEVTNKAFKQRGIKLPLPAQGTTNEQNRKDKGLEIQRQIFGRGIDKANASAPKDQKHIREFLSANCFGDYYTRTGLDLKFRELLTFVYIASMGGAEAQLKAHTLGNLNMGNDRAKLISVITTLIPYIGYPRSLNALNIIDELTQESS